MYVSVCVLVLSVMQIYKSTKCNDVQQTGYCPRASFCAFAHDESKTHTHRTLQYPLVLHRPSPNEEIIDLCKE